MSVQDERPSWGDRDQLTVLNKDVPRVDGPLKVSGRARYSHDIRLPGMLWARVLCCPYPVAKPTVDLEPALALNGVAAAIAIDDQMRAGFTRWLGQPIAAVCATTPELAEDALRAIAVTYELGEWVLDYAQATADGAPAMTREGNVRNRQTEGDEGAAIDALGASDVTVEAVYTLPVQVHACLETHGVVVDYRGGDEATIHASTQGTFTVAEDAASELGIAQNEVTVLVEHMGGGFGAKFGLDQMGLIACRLAKRAQAPVHLLYTRSDEFLAGGNRSGSRQVMAGGATMDGRFKALVSNISKLGGINRGAHPGQPYIYDVETAYSEVSSVHTNTDGNRAMRAPGHPQASFGIESMVDELAHGLGMDPLEFRKRNLTDEVYHRQLDRVAREIGWGEHPNKLGPPAKLPDRAVGIGFGVATWGSGGRPTCQVDVRIGRDGSVSSTVGAQDLGTGTRTYVASIVAEELGLAVEDVTPRIGRSDQGLCVASGGSVTVPSLAPAVKDAAHKARLAMFAHLAEVMDSRAMHLVAYGGEISDRNNPEKRMTWKEACSTLASEGIEVRGVFQAHLSGRGVHGAQAAKVEVDTLTGFTRVLEMVAIQDVGLPLNRLATRSQINGGMIQGMSFGLWEERVLDPVLGLHLNPGFEEYKIAGAVDIPKMTTIIDDDDLRQETLGVGEPPVIPGHSAVANALFNACGVRIRDLPLSRDKIITALQELA